MSYRKKLIEVALPLEAINIASAREKSIRHGHPSTLHLWWARRPLAAARAVIFTSLVDDPDDPNALPAFVEACRVLPYTSREGIEDSPRQRLFQFIERLVTWEATTDEAIIKTARELIMIATEGNPPPLLDPFAGGGSIPLEAQRLGLEAHASDLNPVAVMINKAQIEIPPRFANQPPVNPRDRERMSSSEGWKGAAGLAADVRYYSEWMREKAWEKIGHLYPKHNGETVIAWIWARTVKSPNPAVDIHVPIVRSFILSKKRGKERWTKPIIDSKKETISFTVMSGLPPSGQEGTVDRSGGRCIVSGVPIPFDYIRSEAEAGRMKSQLMAIATIGQNGRNYYSPVVQHEEAAQVEIPDEIPNTNLPGEALGFRVQRYGMAKHKDLFTARQMVALSTFCELVAEAQSEVYKNAVESDLLNDNRTLREGGVGSTAYSEAVGVYLGFTVSKCANMWSNLSKWSSLAVHELVLPVFSRHALSMVWDYAEANPFSESGGNWIDNGLYIPKTLETLPRLSSLGAAEQQDAAEKMIEHHSMISTDPPYYDNIGYADLSDFFYIWLRQALKSIYPSIFGTLLTPKSSELVADPFRFEKKRELANKHFEDGLYRAFSHMRKAAVLNYPLTVYYAFKQTDDDEDEGEQYVSSTGWETMLQGLVQSGFTIQGTWPIRTERSARLRSQNSNALASSIVLVCRPRPDDAPTISRRAFVDALRRELPSALKNMQSGNIAPVDLAQASIGPGMAIYSRYSKVLEADGSPMSVRAALGLINQELDAYLAEQDGEIDADTRFAVAWFEQFAFAEGEFGMADTLARAKNTSVAGVNESGLVTAGRGKVKLLHWKDYLVDSPYDPAGDKRPTVWEATHHLIQELNIHGETGSALLMTKLPSDTAAEARALAYRLYSICERKGWAEHARDYNALVISWAGIGEEAARLKQAREAGDATQQTRLFE